MAQCRSIAKCPGFLCMVTLGLAVLVLVINECRGQVDDDVVGEIGKKTKSIGKRKGRNDCDELQQMFVERGRYKPKYLLNSQRRSK
ncbi:hypothetical protein ElyMa_002598400 [Elysia marginata]|uniref:Uncharacterized protein n=1 Tax=Elysia marginata TaxID=1093978 RepID=A0AAV4H4V8_9GAST|nr:hypothetical protein ElyMa_002598400 [Elysia marginata]